jgi:LTXXQ motif family protein
MRHKRLTTVLGAAALASVIAGTALAQGGPGRMGERGWGMWGEDSMGMWRGGPFGRWWGGPDWMLERVEGRLSFLKTELKITEAQMPAWNEFTQAVRTAAKQRNERMKGVLSGEEKARTLPERVQTHEQFMTARLEEVKQIKASVQNLYALLSDEQKKEADEMVIPMVGMGGPGWAM